MLDRPDVKPIALDSVSRLAWVAPPAGYIILIQDVAYGSRYKIARHQQLDRQLMRRGADFPFETRVARIWQADDAAAAERDLHDEIAAGTTIGEWFDLYQFPTASSAPVSQDESVSLRDLAQHSGDAESLLQDAKIVGAGRHRSTPQAAAGGPASAPQTSAPAEGRAATTRRPRRARWAFALGLLVLAGFFLAERSNDIRRAIDSVLDPSSRPAISNRAAAPTTVASGTGSASPTPKVAGRGEVFYTKTRANVRACANLSCKVLAVLSPSAKIVAQRYAEGQRINGSDRWILFRFRGQDANIHSSVVSRVRRISEPSPEPSPIAKPTRVQATVVGHNEVFYIAADIQARACARTSCAAAGLLPLGARVTALQYSKGQSIKGSDRWIRFYHDGKHVYLHSSHLTRTQPKFAAIPTAKPTQIRVADDGQGEVFYVVAKANARLCALLSCAIEEVFERGTRITALRYQKGQLINGSDRWIRFINRGWIQYVHSSFLSREKPGSDSSAEASATVPPSLAPEYDDDKQFYVKAGATADVRTCARLTCHRAAVLKPGAEIMPILVVNGQSVDGNAKWVMFEMGSHRRFVHIGSLTQIKPMPEPASEPSPTRLPLRDEYTARIAGQAFYVKSGLTAKVRNCASQDCFEVDKLRPGMRIEAKRIVRGQTIGGNNEWIMFSFDGWNRFVHRGDLSPLKPRFVTTAAATDTAADTEPPPTETEPTSIAIDTVSVLPPTATATVPPVANYVVETAGNVNANIRSCPRTGCDIVAKFKPGTEVEVISSVTGETVYETDVWLEIRLESGSAFIHSGLVAEAG